MSWAPDDQQVRRVDLLRPSVSDGHAVHIGVWMCVPYAVTNCLGDFMSVAEHALVHDCDLHPSAPTPAWINRQQSA
jgi:hypothetical protein